MAKTITTFLVSGNPEGIKTVELSNWIGKALVIPRALLKEAKKRPEIERTAIYFLFGKGENGEDSAYIGEAENFLNRIVNHDTNKDFWDIAVAFVSKDENLTKADVKFLEARAVEIAKRSNRYELKNSTEPNRNNLPEHQIATMEEFLENVGILMSAIGFPILQIADEKNGEDMVGQTYYCKGPDAHASGRYTESGFVVHAGSTFRSKPTDSAGKWLENIHADLLQRGVLKVNGVGASTLEQDYVFPSPSAAAGAVLFRSANGWTEWKTKEGKTLDAIERGDLK